MYRESAAVLKVRRIVQRIEQLRVHHRRQEIECCVRGRNDYEQRCFLIAEGIKVDIIRKGKVSDFRQIERLQPDSSGNKD